MGCRNCLRRFVARMSPRLRLAPIVPVGSRVARKYDPLLLRGNVRFAPIMCVPDAFQTIRCVFWTACSEYRLNPKPGTYATSITLPVENDTHIPDLLYFYPPTIPDRGCFATGRREPHIICPCPVVRHMIRRVAVGNPNIILIAARLHQECIVLVSTRYSNIPYHAFTLYVQLAWWRKLRQGGLFVEEARGRLGRNGRSLLVRRRGG